MQPPRSENELARQAALHECDVLAGSLRTSLDGMARLAASLCNAPIGTVSLVDEDRQIFCGCIGLDFRETSRADSFCGWTILGSGPMVIADAREDDRFKNNPMVVGPPGLRFYAGFPLRTSDGLALGALCVCDTTPRTLTDLQMEQLTLLADQVASQLELRRWRAKFESERRASELEAAAARAAQRELAFQKYAFDQHALVAVTDAAGVITCVNERFCAVSGWTQMELIGRKALDGAMESVSEHASYPQMIAAMARGDIWQGELCNRTKSGRLYWLNSTIVPCCDEAGNVTRYVGISTDITDRKLAEQRVGEVEESARLIVDAAPDAVVIIDAAGAVTGWNATAESIFGYTRAEITGRCLDELIIPERFREAHRKGIERYTRTGNGGLVNRRVEMWALHKDGREMPVELAITPIRRGGEIFFSAFIRDITERRRASEELRRAKDDAEAAARAKAEFLANMSHEIRTPMTALLGFTELLTSDSDYAGSPGNRADAIQAIRRNGEHLLTIINDVLDVSRIEAGKMNIERVPMSPRRIVDEVVELMSMRAFQRGLSLTATCAADTPPVILSDPVRFRQIITNLVSNAIKFTEHGSIKAHLSSTRRADGAVELRVSVEDTGCGIAPDQLPMLFDSFWQADASTTRRFGGTGLGLRISKSLAELLGGTIDVRSEPGRGSVFTASIVAACVGDEPPPQAAPPTPVPAGKGALEHIRILLAEDGPDNQRLLTHHLTRAGAIVRVVEHGRAAVDAILDPNISDGVPSTPDLIIMDMQMPEMDGYTATRTLREHGVRVPVLALTAHAMQHDRQRCLDAGCDEYASKPIDRATLLAVCRRLIGEGETSPPTPLPCPHA